MPQVDDGLYIRWSLFDETSMKGETVGGHARNFRGVEQFATIARREDLAHNGFVGYHGVDGVLVDFKRGIFRKYVD